MAAEKTNYVGKTDYADNSVAKEYAAGIALAYGGSAITSFAGVYIAKAASDEQMLAAQNKPALYDPVQYQFGLMLGIVGTCVCAIGGTALIIDAACKSGKKNKSGK